MTDSTREFHFEKSYLNLYIGEALNLLLRSRCETSSQIRLNAKTGRTQTKLLRVLTQYLSRATCTQAK